MLHVGDTLMVRAAARDPFTRELLNPMPAKMTVQFWAPGVDRRNSEPSYGPYTMDRNTFSKYFSLYVGTDGWPAGTYTYGILAEDVVKNREYGTFTLAE